MKRKKQFCDDLLSSINQWGVLSNKDYEEIDNSLITNVIEYLEAVKCILENKNYTKNCNCDRDTKPDQCLHEIN